VWKHLLSLALLLITHNISPTLLQNLIAARSTSQKLIFKLDMPQQDFHHPQPQSQ
jgi:hypothetical protein